MVSADFLVKLCDFGYSAKYMQNEIRQTLCGTYEYMAPEVIFNGRQTKKTDIWALGILLYELFHGHAPFKGTTMEGVMMQIRKGVVRFKKQLDPKVKDLIVKILVMNPLKRPSIEEVLSHPLFGELSSGEIHSLNEGRTLKATYSSSRVNNLIQTQNQPKKQINCTNTPVKQKFYIPKQFLHPLSEQKLLGNYNNNSIKPQVKKSKKKGSQLTKGVLTNISNYLEQNQNFIKPNFLLKLRKFKEKRKAPRNDSFASFLSRKHFSGSERFF